jgi:hypothetical protein
VKRAVVYTAAIALLLSGGVTAATEASGEARRLEDRPRVARCADRHPWTRVGQREELVWCIAHTFDSPGPPRTAIAVGHCESGADLQDRYGGDGHIGTFQQITSRWHDRWRTWGQRIGVKDEPRNVLSQAVVSVRMARSLGTWNSSAGWAGCA